MEKFEKWTLAPFGGQFDVYEIKYSGEGISFVMYDDKGTVEPFGITWRHENIIAYNVTDETYRADLWNCDGRFYRAKDSKYLNIFKAKSPLFPQNAEHFVIVGTNTIIDMIATSEPEVK